MRPDGQERYVRAFARVIRDESGVPVRMTGVNVDNSERMRAEIEDLTDGEAADHPFQTLAEFHSEGGDTAAEEALYLAKLARKVYIAHRRDELRASKILQKRVMGECKIEMLWNTVLTEILADDAGVVGVRLKDTLTAAERDLDMDGVFIFIGFEPNNQIVPAGVKMNAEGYVMTDANCQTAINGIYAIGDLREKTFRQIVISAADGSVAALASAHYVEMRKESPEACELPADLLT